MVISKPPKARKAAAERFIEGAPDAGAAEAPANIPAPTRQKKETISLGLDPALLARADAAAARFGVSRAALIAMALTRFVDSEQ
ncbi:CopG family transcriptional regulator [Burkholderia sp. ISTR5]|uniref:CopG family transcriptional regulator n=1 Tax=Burkholderia sp. ISTR5 TaxID=2500161 RepID=UPI00136C44A9|nr:CopG family transcriptional regulator [Burkholderia sp. ISTR5]NBI45432.1 CopG family transcriptional regulator [Burkholderia sp. ISTR5]